MCPIHSRVGSQALISSYKSILFPQKNLKAGIGYIQYQYQYVMTVEGEAGVHFTVQLVEMSANKLL